MSIQKRRTVLIAGAGELGSRYLQSLAASCMPLDIHLLSLHSASLEVCRQRWADAAKAVASHTVTDHLDLDAIPAALDLAVVSSTAETRPELVAAIAEKSAVDFWVLEKVLAQSPDGLAALDRATAGAKGRWVNYYMSSQDLYAEVKKRLAPGRPRHMRITGGEWGLACNSLHFIHLQSWFNDSPLVSLAEVALAKSWHEAKRSRNWEVFGELEAGFANGARLTLSAAPGPVAYQLFITDGAFEWEIVEAAGLARRNDGLEIACPVPYQSGRRLLLDILRDGVSALPTLDAVAAVDARFLRLMLDCWRRSGHPEASSVPIT
jgi:hypothetical protein